MASYLLVGLGAFFGGIFRGMLGSKFNRKDTTFPKGTLLANMLGAILIGLLSAMFVQKELIGAAENQLLVIGFCGGLTTFSTFTMETVTLFFRKKLNLALAYWFISLVLSLCLVWLTYNIGLKIF